MLLGYFDLSWQLWRLFHCPPPPSYSPAIKNCRVKSSLLFRSPFLPHLNYLLASCPLMKASSHGNEGNQINCMSANRITSSLTRHESGLKLITHAWKNGRLWEGRCDRAGGSPRGGDSLLHAHMKVIVPVSFNSRKRLESTCRAYQADSSNILYMMLTDIKCSVCGMIQPCFLDFINYGCYFTHGGQWSTAAVGLVTR